MLSDRDREIINAAEELASNYDGDDRQDIKTDVMNAFYAGAKFIAERDALAIKEKDDAQQDEFIYVLTSKVKDALKFGSVYATLHSCVGQMLRPESDFSKLFTHPQSKDDAVREALDLVFENCRVIYFPTSGEYPLEHNPHANKDSKAEIIRALIEPKD